MSAGRWIDIGLEYRVRERRVQWRGCGEIVAKVKVCCDEGSLGGHPEVKKNRKQKKISGLSSREAVCVIRLILVYEEDNKRRRIGTVRRT